MYISYLFFGFGYRQTFRDYSFILNPEILEMNDMD
jgi:hypothetical protein